jgi:hypothetical protein
MPQKRSAPAQTAEELARVVTGPDPDRFYCPHPGCNRSFAELWRLKVHYRAPPDVRGSGKERGHGTELAFCPKCGKDLRPGKHHVGCAAGKSAPRQAAKRQRQQQMSTTTESAGLTAGTTGATTEATTGSWELAVQRQRAKVAQQAAAAAQRGEADSARTKALAHARACRLEQALTHNLDVVPTGDLLFHPASVAHAAATQHGGGHGVTPAPGQHYFAATAGVAPLPPAAPAAQQQAAQAAAPQQPVGLDLPGGVQHQHRPLSPSPLELFGDPLFGGSTAPAGDGGHGGGGGGHGGGHSSLLLDDHHLHDDDLLRIPSPPPLPADWETAPRPGLLFDFDQFDLSKKPAPGTSAPLVTVTTAMNPVDVSNPSDDYIWQILFAGENDAVPKRVTAHLHHPPATALSYLDEPDSLLDALLSEDMGDPLGLGGGPHHNGHHGSAAQQEQQPGSGGTSGASGLVPSLPEPAAVAVQQQQGGGMGGNHHHHHHHHMGMHHHMLSEAQVVPQQQQQHKPLGAAPAVAPYRNGGFGGPVVAAAPTDVLHTVKVDGASFLS